METKVQLKHPAGKKAVSMDKIKYEWLKKTVLRCLNNNGQSTHEEICNAVTGDFKKNKIKFEGSIPWHTEWVKLDLEAKKEIKRITGTSPIKFALW